MLRYILFSLFITTSLLTGCKKKEKAADGAPAGDTKTEAFKGELTEDVLSKANRAIQAYKSDGTPADFAPTLAAAKKELGEPTHVDGATYGWGFAAGDKCTYYSLIDEGGKAKAPGVMTVDKAMSGMYGKCMAAIGKAAADAPPAGSDAPPAGSADGSATGSGAATP